MPEKPQIIERKIHESADKIAAFMEPPFEIGIILAEAEYAIAEGATAMDILMAAAQANDIIIDAGDGYVQGIANIYEFDCGEKSGWMYLVNGAFASLGANEYEVQEGDVISFLYSCDWGNDLPIEE